MNRRLNIIKSGMETATGKYGQYGSLDGQVYVFHRIITLTDGTVKYRWRCREHKTCKYV